MRKSIVLIIVAGGLFFPSQAFSPNIEPVGEIPGEVNKVLVLSCYDCHSSDASNEDARKALNFEKWNEYRVTKRIGLLEKICEIIEEDKMQPVKYLKNKPDRKLSVDQKTLICDWSTKESSALMGGN